MIGPAEYTIVILNVCLGLGLAWPLAGVLAGLGGKPSGRGSRATILVLVYLMECVAVSASMGSNVLGICLAILWGFLLARRLCRLGLATRSIRQAVLFFSLYTSLPAASLFSVPAVAALNGWPVLTVEDGTRFGIPEWLPPPMNTILGFFIVVSIGGVVAKVAITTGIARIRGGISECTSHAGRTP